MEVFEVEDLDTWVAHTLHGHPGRPTKTPGSGSGAVVSRGLPKKPSCIFIERYGNLTEDRFPTNLKAGELSCFLSGKVVLCSGVWEQGALPQTFDETIIGTCLGINLLDRPFQDISRLLELRSLNDDAVNGPGKAQAASLCMLLSK